MTTIIFKSEKKAKFYEVRSAIDQGVYKKGELIIRLKTDNIERAISSYTYQVTATEISLNQEITANKSVVIYTEHCNITKNTIKFSAPLPEIKLNYQIDYVRKKIRGITLIIDGNYTECDLENLVEFNKQLNHHVAKLELLNDQLKHS